ncbi:MAG TPA: hypothetical protein VGF97_05075 [Rhizomicrobium sp.]|jgi:hypothetical protein
MASSGGFPWPGGGTSDLLLPSTDETPIDSDGSAETDAIVGCYANLLETNLSGARLGPPHIVWNPKYGDVLRADFFDEADPVRGIHRLVCWSGGSEHRAHLRVPPLDPPGTAAVDANSNPIVQAWLARRNAGRQKELAARPYPAPEADTATQLEGVWSIEKKPDKGSCISNWYSQSTEIEFEFRKSGGRALVFEVPDQFTPISISGIARSGDSLTLQTRLRTGGYRDVFRIRLHPPNRIEMTSLAGLSSGPSSPRRVAYKCGEADLSVNAGVSPDSLAKLSPPVTGGWSFPAAIPGVRDEDLCNGRGANLQERWRAGGIQFELYGPVHYWAFGLLPAHKLAFDFVRSIKEKGNGTFVMQMQERIEKGTGWDVPESRGKTYQLTIIDHGGRIEIPELATSFVRCKEGDGASAGMHRF